MDFTSRAFLTACELVSRADHTHTQPSLILVFFARQHTLLCSYHPYYTQPRAIVAAEMAVDLHSRSATLSPDIRFLPTPAADATIYTFRAASVQGLIFHLVNALRGEDEAATLRLEGEDGPLVPQTDSQGTLLFVHDAASVGGRAEQPVAIFAVFGEQGDKDIRWFWTEASPVGLLEGLGATGVIEEREMGELVAPAMAHRLPGRPTKWEKVYTFIATAFSQAIAFPHSTEYAQAMQITDYCPSIVPADSTAACRIIEANEYLNFNGQAGRDLSDDRYILELEPAERMLASIVSMKCAAYMLFKRQYFKACARDCVLESEKVRRSGRRDSVTTAADVKTDPIAPTDTTTRQHATSTPSVFKTSSPAPSTDITRGTTTNTRGRPRGRAGRPRGRPRGTGRRASRIVVLPIAAPTTTPSSPAPAPRTSPETDAGDTYHAARATAARTGARNMKLQVRTENAHIRGIEALMNWNFSRAKKLYVGWKLLGFMDEERMLARAEGEWSESESDNDG